MSKKYWGSIEEELIKEYNSIEDEIRRNKIINRLYSKLVKMGNSILLRYYSSYVTNENTDDLVADAITHTLLSIDRYDSNSSKKAYSYIGTTIKHYFHNEFVVGSKANYRNRYTPIDNMSEFDSITDISYGEVSNQHIKDEMVLFMNKILYKISSSKIVNGKKHYEVFDIVKKYIIQTDFELLSVGGMLNYLWSNMTTKYSYNYYYELFKIYDFPIINLNGHYYNYYDISRSNPKDQDKDYEEIYELYSDWVYDDYTPNNYKSRASYRHFLLNKQK